MKFSKITEEVKVFPGEYILHTPTNQIVLCGAFNREGGTIRALASGKMITDTISNFQKIKVDRKERKEQRARRKCGGCGKK